MLNTHEVKRSKNYDNPVVFIDGLWSSGKSLVAPFVQSINGVQKSKINPIYEHVAKLNSFGQISDEAAIWLLQTQANLDLFHNAIGRDVNLRLTDDSGLKYVRDKFRYLFTPFKLGIKDIENAQEFEEFKFCNMSHMLFSDFPILQRSFGQRLRFIEVVTHPLELIGGFQKYLADFDRTREATFSIVKGSVKVPWFMVSDANSYIHSDDATRAVLSVGALTELLIDFHEFCVKQRIENCFFINAADLKLTPHESIKPICTFLEGSIPRGELKWLMKKLKLPRRKSNITKVQDDAHESIKSSVSSPVLSKIERIIARFEATFPVSQV